MHRPTAVLIGSIACALVVGAFLLDFDIGFREYRSEAADLPERFIPLPELDRTNYDARLAYLAHVATSTLAAEALATTTASTTLRRWPATATYPNAGAVLPFKRIVAYYGNFYSARMGVLGEYQREDVLARLSSTTALWAAVDPKTPTVPAIQYIAVVAQGTPGREGNYILRMPDSEIERALGMANELGGLLFLDVQVGKSTLARELPLLERYLALPQVHLAIDPEFSMKRGGVPGQVIGTYDAADVNYAASYLADLVRAYHLPPKILVVHRFTQDMLTNTDKITPLSEVEIVIDMDGWGPKWMKKDTYEAVIEPEPVQFTGIKLFYHADLKPPSTGLLSPQEVLALTPAPIYIQYQ